MVLAELAALEDAIEGTVLVDGSPDHELLRKLAWAQFTNVRPEAAVLCSVPEDFRFHQSIPPAGGS